MYLPHTHFLVSCCLSVPQQGCTEGLFHQSQHYIDIFCANMMELNRRAEAVGYTYRTRDLFMENSEPNLMVEEGSADRGAAYTHSRLLSESSKH